MTPYGEPVATSVKAHYNRHHSRSRCVFEQAFGMLKACWRSIFLKALEVNPNFVPTVVTCCVILHNMCSANGDVLKAEDVITNDDDVANHEENAEPQGVICGAAMRSRLAAGVSAPDIHVPALMEHDYV